jgi:hypothetical protein
MLNVLNTRVYELTLFSNIKFCYHLLSAPSARVLDETYRIQREYIPLRCLQ